MDAKMLKGMAIVSIDEGVRLGRIEDVLFDTHVQRVAAVRAKHDGESFLISFAQLKHVGPDAVTADSSRTVQLVPEDNTSEHLCSLGRVEGLKVIGEDGSYLGQVQCVEIDESTGQILALEVHKGGMFGIGGQTTRLEGDAIRSIGPELVTATMTAAGSDAPHHSSRT